MALYKCVYYYYYYYYIKSPTSIKSAAVQADWTGLYLPVFQYTAGYAGINFIQQLAQTGSVQHFMLKFL